MKEEVKNGLEDLYTDYLMVSTGPCTATGLSKLSTGENSHARITRLLYSDGSIPRSLAKGMPSSGK
jgi:hypothetical protein